MEASLSNKLDSRNKQTNRKVNRRETLKQEIPLVVASWESACLSIKRSLV